jgi:hypothetical protein
MKLTLLTSVATAALVTNVALAADLASKKAEPPAPPPAWADTLTVTGWLSGGITPNFSNHVDDFNFGHLFTDRTGPLFNQGVLTIQRPLDPKATGFDYGFKVQGMVGSDARYTHFLGELDYVINSRTQLDIVEAFAIAHFPVLFEGGVDVKVGQFVTLEGAELITAPDNVFYSHSYIFNFGIPLKHTGVMTTSHIAPWLDVYAGVTTGVNTSIGWPGDNNNAASFHGGIGLNLFDGELTVLATTHIGPETPKQLDPFGVGWPNTPLLCGCDPNNSMRYLNDMVVTWKATENLTFITDLNFIRDDGWNPDPFTGRGRGVDGYGIAQYATYKINDIFKIGGRFEVWRDNNGFFVAGFPTHFGFANAQHGFPAVTFAAPPTTYLALTAGVTITPEIPKNPIITGLILRPEIRYDTSLNDTRPFVRGTRGDQVTFGFDAIIPFTLH